MSDYLAFLAKIHIFVEKEFETYLGFIDLFVG